MNYLNNCKSIKSLFKHYILYLFIIFNLKLNVCSNILTNKSHPFHSSLKQQLEESTVKKRTLEQEFRSLDDELREAQASWRNTQNLMSKQTDFLNREKRKIADLEREIQNIE